jgi:hypothetical protein
VIAVALNEANFRGWHFVPELQKDETIPSFHFQGAANAGLFLPVGINVFLVLPENVPTVTAALAFSTSTARTPARRRYNSSRAGFKLAVSSDRQVRRPLMLGRSKYTPLDVLR